ncbi:MAG: cytochrome c oxidase assembly protein [Rhodospirillales bacterium]|nr:cytochrome c oxidase assembly protein [Rhodospirillales bacterium]MCB9964608.1 cytochrome c oxidase assembly protein [Rhodospirillales bacterium]MCB9979897.1 cytochrome c oxidase assembly protein [Rhodospirillales bacterium]
MSDHHNPSSSSSSEALRRRNRRTGLWVLGIVVAMVGLAFASVPLYSLFCRVTGFAGTTRVATAGAAHKILDRQVTIKFNTDVNAALPWQFAPEVRSMDLKVGQDGLVNFIAENISSTPAAGTALYNVVPAKVGRYFNKIQCFCFSEQILQPGEHVNMPVLFYVDPAFDQDPYMKDVNVITLSYTFFRTESPELDRAMETFYEQ